MAEIKITNSITTRNETTSRYFSDIDSIPMITPDEEVELSERIKQGDQDAVNRLVEANLRFVVSVAKQYESKDMPLQDLINEGNIGLIKAAHRFDATRGFKFISYAVWWIRQAIMQSINDNNRIVRVPHNQLNSLSKLNKAISAFQQQNHRAPSADELSKILEMKVDKVEDVMSITSSKVSLDAPLTADTDSNMLDVLPSGNKENESDHIVDEESLKIEIERCLSQLNARESDIIRMSFGIGTQALSLEEIGIRLDLTRERVRQLRERALRTLRTDRFSANLKPYACA